MKKLLALSSLIFCSTVFAQDLEFKQSDIPIDDLQLFTTVIEHIKNYYVNPTDDEQLFESAIRGMLSGLDPHSTYLNAEEFSDLKENTSGKFGGLGIEVTMEDGFIRIITPIDDTPADKAGIQPGDLIIRLDDTPVKGLSLKEAVDIMRGKRGEPIVLTIIRKDEAKPIKITVLRDIIEVKSVKSKILEPGLAYIRVSQFQDDTGKELIAVLTKLNKPKPLKGLILDLRNNPGGVFEASVQISNAFLEQKKLQHDSLIVYTKGRLSGVQIKEKASGKDLLQGAPLVILVNAGSASASEIVAGALQDHGRAIIVGTKTFGKGSVQTVLPMKDKRALKLTTALYYTPSGRSIQATGITPDIIVENMKIPEAVADNNEDFFIKEKDLQRHLENTTGKTAVANTKEEDDIPLIQKDYQLHEALNILKSLTFVKQKST